MDVLDEKANGTTPQMEVEEIVSVRDRMSLIVHLRSHFRNPLLSFHHCILR